MFGFIDTTPVVSTLIGVPVATLQQWLLTAQTALFNLNIGGQPISVSYSQSDGSRSVTYKTADIGNLTAFILQLQSALGMVSTRRPLRPTYF